MTEHEHVFAELAKPFASSELQWKVQAVSRDRRRALVLPYLDARAVMDRLDAVLGPGGWHDSYEVDHEHAQAKCRLTVLGVSKEDVGEGMIGGSNPALSEDRPSSIKAAVSDALKRAAVKFGIGRYLYRLESTWVDYDDEKKRPLELPKLPEWALPTPAVLTMVSGHDLVEQPLEESTAFPLSSLPPEGDRVLSDLVRELRELPGGEAAIRRILGQAGLARKSATEKRRVYGELRRVYRELSAGLPESA